MCTALEPSAEIFFYSPHTGSDVPRLFSQLALHSSDLAERVSWDQSNLMHSGSCCIYKGVLEPGRTQVAVKVVRYTDQDPVPILKRTLREVHVWSKLNHNNILPLLGVTTKLEATVSLVSPWMPKGNAFEYVQNRVIDPRPLILDIAQGLSYLHSHQEGPILHGDVKGTNVLISREGRALLSDFGFSLLVGGRPRDCMRPGDALNWMPPEYLESDECATSAEGDVWSFGMTALELFTAKPPFGYLKHNSAMVFHILFREHERPESETTGFRLTDGWWDICQSCWNRHPSQRPNMSRLVEDVEALLTLSGVCANPSPDVQENADNCASPYSANLKHTLQELSKRAYRHSVNLNGRVTRNNGVIRRGGYATVYEGTLRTQGTTMFTGSARHSPPKGEFRTTKYASEEMHLLLKQRGEYAFPCGVWDTENRCQLGSPLQGHRDLVTHDRSEDATIHAHTVAV